MVIDRTNLLVSLFLMKTKPLIFVFIVLTMYSQMLLAILTVGYSRSLLDIHESLIGAKDGLVISSFALSPFTSIIDSAELEKIFGDTSDIEIEYHMITLAHIYRTPVIIKSDPSISEECIILNRDIANKYSLNTESIVPVYSIFTHRTIFLRICGLTDSDFSYTSYRSSIEIRGVKQGVYSFAVIKSNNPEALRKLYEALGMEWSENKILTRGLILLQRLGDKRVARYYEDLSQGYLDRLGLHRDLLVYMGYGVSLITLINSIIIGIGLATLLQKEIIVLNRMGFTRLTIFYSLILVLLIASAAVNSLVYLTIDTGLYPRLYLLSFTMKPSVTIFDYILINLMILILAAMGLFHELRDLVV